MTSGTRSNLAVAAVLAMAGAVGAFDKLPRPKEARERDHDKEAKQAAKLRRRASRAGYEATPHAD